jgi:cytochrome c oxidase subunit 1
VTRVATGWQERSLAQATRPERGGVAGWFGSQDHKRIGLLTIGTALLLFVAMGALALLMRTQLARPDEHLLSTTEYNELFTLHGSGMIYLVVTPVAIGLGVYLVPLQLGLPVIAAPRLTLFGYWLYAFGGLAMLSGFLTNEGAAQDGWFAYPPLSSSRYTPGFGMDVWVLGVFCAAIGMLLQSGTVLWTLLRMRPPRMTLLRMPVFCWSMVATCLMSVMAFPSLLAAMSLLALGRIHPTVFDHNVWNIGYQHLFWFYGHPVVYVMFFPFVGVVSEVVATFAGRRYFGYKLTVLSLLLFAALSMSVWGHHMFATGQASDDYYSLTSTSLSVPGGIEYFGIIGTLLGGRLRYPTPMLFAITFLPQFLVGGLTGIMIGSPALDVHVHDSYFIVAHFHYTLMAGSVFGLFAGLYYWFPKMTGLMYDERLGRIQFGLMVVGTNMAFLPMFWSGYEGMPRRVTTYPADATFSVPNLISTIGAYILGAGMLVLIANLVRSLRVRRPAGPDPWGGTTLEWVSASPPPRFNFDGDHPLPPITSYAPLLDARLRAAEREKARA